MHIIATSEPGNPVEYYLIKSLMTISLRISAPILLELIEKLKIPLEKH